MKFAILTAVVSALTLVILHAVAIRTGWVDRPDQRKAHSEAVPAVGGIAWCVGLMAGCYVAGLWSDFGHLLIAVSLLTLIGAYDDYQPLPSVFRLAAQAAVALFAVYGHADLLRQFGDLIIPGSQIVLPIWLAWVVTIFACVGVINAFNMIDGMDGSLGMVSLVALVCIIALMHRAGMGSEARVAGLAFAALLPFLWLNVRTPWRKSAKVFFGDAGSTALGLLIGFLLIRGSQNGPQRPAVFEPVMALYLVAIPLIDTVSLMIRRIAMKRSPFSADQAHFHHLLQRAGYRVSSSCLIILAVSAAFATSGIAMQFLGVPDYLELALFLSFALTYHLWISRALLSGRWLGRDLADSLTR